MPVGVCRDLLLLAPGARFPGLRSPVVDDDRVDELAGQLRSAGSRVSSGPVWLGGGSGRAIGRAELPGCLLSGAGGRPG